MYEKPNPSELLLHYGVARKSGRYPWGSGEDPRGASVKFLRNLDTLKSRGLKETEIAQKLGLNTTQLRDNIRWANAEIDNYNVPQARVLKEQGMSNVAIGKELGVSEATVRNYLSKKSPAEKSQKVQLDNIAKSIKDGVDRTGYLDVGIGVERQLGIPRTKFKSVVNKLVKDEDYYLHDVHVKRLSDNTVTDAAAGVFAKYTTIKVLTKDPDPASTSRNRDKIRPLDSWSDDGAQTLVKLKPPEMVSLDRIKVRYAEEGGKDKDGTIELRPGVKDLDLGNKKYAQVRIGAGKDLFLKGMAIYGDAKDFPKGVDIIYNRPESKDIPKEKVLKKMKMTAEQTDDPSFMFGSSVRRQKGALNIVNEEGEWAKWGKTMSSQFLSKQPASLIKDRLDDTFAGLKKEYDEINSMTNPVVKKFLMDKFVEGLDSKAKHLKAKGLTGTMSHVLLPFPGMKQNEIYATNYKNGDRVVLVRHPHGGTFEIPDLVVNNRYPLARKLLGDAPDAVGIHPTVAEKLSGADFDGDTALVIPNNKGVIQTSRSLKELKNFEPKDIYKVDHQTITNKAMQTQMGKVSNLITDMTIKGASESELARAVRHSMVVIDSYKHHLDYKQSERDHAIPALQKKYQQHIHTETGKLSIGASTLISRSKNRIDISQHTTVKDLYNGKKTKDGKVSREGMSVSEIAKRLKISEETVNGYLKGKEFDPDKYVSDKGTAQEQLYSNYIKNIQSIKNESSKTAAAIKPPAYSKEAAKKYTPQKNSLNEKLNIALLNAPKARQVQILTNKLYAANKLPDMDKDEKKKLKSRCLAKATTTVGAKKSQIKITPEEWEAIQAGAISKTMLLKILDNADIDTVRKLATPRPKKLSDAKADQARAFLAKGYTYSEVAERMGMSSTALREELSDGE